MEQDLTKYNLPEHITEKEVLDLIEMCINEDNMFWWGVIIGIRYGVLSRVRIDKKEDPNMPDYDKIVKIQYRHHDEPGKIIEWY